MTLNLLQRRFKRLWDRYIEGLGTARTTQEKRALDDLRDQIVKFIEWCATKSTAS